MSAATAASVRAPFYLRLFHWWLEQVRHTLPAVIFFFIGFNLILWTQQMVLMQHGIPFSGFAAATVAALLVGKAVLVTDHMPFMRRFEGAPLIQPILFKSVIYWAVTFVVRILDGYVHFLGDGGATADFLPYLAEQFSWPRFFLVQVWLMVLFLIYVTIHELNTLFGDGELARIFLRWRSTQTKLTRRQRIRLLTRLARLTEAHDVAEFRNASTPAHAELVEIITLLAKPAGAHAR